MNCKNQTRFGLPRTGTCGHRTALKGIALALVLLVLGSAPGFLADLTGMTPAANAMTELPNFSALAEQVSPAVVNIRTVKTIKGGGRVFRHFRGPFGNDDPMDDLFKRFFGGDPHRDFKQRSLGSGFIFDKEGLIVTNNHVVEDADEILVILKNEKEYEAEVIGRDANTDLALIKIKTPADLPVAVLGDSESLKIGEWVMAIGSPFGLEHTVTAGIVSAKGRVIGSGPYDDFIQTDASINPGNSGGPLINLDGEVVGINTAIIARGQGIGFAIPINMAKGIIAQLKDSGSVTRGWLGVTIKDLPEDLAEYLDVPGGEGALVMDVVKGDPADKAGIQSKDVIVSIDGRKVASSRDLTAVVAGIPVGEKVGVKIIRQGKPRTLTVKIGKRPDDPEAAVRKLTPQEEDALGLTVTDLTDEMARRFNLPEAEGIIVEEVESESQAQEAGVLVGDVIREINHQPIASVEDYQRVMKDLDKGDDIQLFIWRANTGFMVIKMTK